MKVKHNKTDYFETMRAMEVVKWNGPKIKYQTILDFTNFAKQVFEEHGGEAFAILVEKDGKIGLQIVPQTTQGLSVKWTNEYPGQGLRQIGSIHSHCDCAAFFSGTDTDSHKDMQGLHICVGNVEDFLPSVAVCIASLGDTLDIELEDVIETGKGDDEWMEKVTRRSSSSGVAGSQLGSYQELEDTFEDHDLFSSMETPLKKVMSRAKKVNCSLKKQSTGKKRLKILKR